MAGVRWVAERRVLRRASHQSLKVPVFREQSFTDLSQNSPADSYARGDWDAGYRRDDWAESDAERTGPLATVGETSPPESARMDDVSWDEATRREQLPPPANTLTFKPAVRPWYGSPRVLLLVLGAAVIAMIVAGVLLVLRHSSDGTEESTTVTPTATTGAVPPSAPPSDPVGEQPLPPAEIPPPPPPPEETTNAPSNTGGGYRWYPPSQSDTPTGRPREPAPISVSPMPHEAPSPGHAAPGDAPRRGGFFG